MRFFWCIDLEVHGKSVMEKLFHIHARTIVTFSFRQNEIQWYKKREVQQI